MRLSISDSKSTALAYAKVLVGICAILMMPSRFPPFICSSMIRSPMLAFLANMTKPLRRVPLDLANLHAC